MARKKSKKVKYKYEKAIISFFVFLLTTFIFVNKPYKNILNKKENETKNLSNEYHVEINEEVVLKEYTKNKRDINSISYDDYANLNLSKKKIESILEYKEYMGQINEIKELENIPYISSDDLSKISKVFKDASYKKYKRHNINKMTKKELKYLGLSNYDIKKIISYRKKYKIKNLIELEKIIGNKYNLKNIEF
ncbi:hypothetical protein [Oceanivirga miroungae]|uniref:Uncharacterized protein n=1 Tax=Oceanivirga miroungae TaxID=1130046 RepID=A0A6I8M704_9FUSO|nr:hypothetical protein [Oceanivirga miroungae]VWL85277.1 hypothetical protein OMES3154_00560 [Oceanivirga miroungae]